MSALAQNINSQPQPQSVTSISASARVDYILRFSKQAVMVIDEQISVCSDVGRQYLASLSNEQNAAYITMSAKLNDLQVRCRIIEQLFGNILFDPEQSVAVSVINLVKADKQAVTIVVDNAQHLSLQLLHELAQLAEIAKKADYHINVLMLATPLAGHLVYQHQALFHKKLTIVSAQNGQLIAHNAKLFKQPSSLLTLTPFKKWLVFFTCLSIISTAIVYSLYQRDAFSFSKVIDSSSLPLTDESAEVFVSEVANAEQKSPESTPTNDTAVSAEIYSALTTENTILKPTEKVIIEPAQPNDIVNAILATEALADLTFSEETTVIESTEWLVDEELPDDIASQQNKKPQISDESSADQQVVVLDEPIMTPKQVVPARYLEQQHGYVIQIAAFSHEDVLNEFKAEFTGITFHQYQKAVAGNIMTILTSDFYQTREQAENAMQVLPQGIISKSPWIKTIEAINSEINQFQRSQSELNHVTIPNS